MSTPPHIEPLPTCRAGQIPAAPPEGRWLVRGLWPEQGVGVLGGPPKACKSWLALEISVAVAAGIPCLGRFEVVNRGPTLVYLAEDSLPAVGERVASLCRARELDLAALDVHLITVPSLRLDVEDDFRRLVATVRELRPRLLVLDPLVRLHRADENRAGEVAAILGRLRTMQRSLGSGILLVHHARKATSGLTHGQALRGSTDLYAWVDSLLYLTRDERGLALSIEHRAAPSSDPLYLALDPHVPHLRPVDAVENDRAPSLDARILAHIDQAAGHPLRRTELRARLAVNNQQLGDALQRLCAAGHLRRTPEGWSR